MKNMNLNIGFDAGNENRLIYLDVPGKAPAEGDFGKKRTTETGYIEGFNDKSDAEIKAGKDAERMAELGEKSFNSISDKEMKEFYALKNKASGFVEREPLDKLDMHAGEKMLEDSDNPHYQEGTPLAERSGTITDDTMEADTDKPEPTHKEQLEKYTGVVDLEGRVIPEKADSSTAEDTGERVDAPTSASRSADEQISTTAGDDPLSGAGNM